MTRLRPEVQRYIENAFPRAGVTTIAGDASTRRFMRIRSPDGGSRVLMDYGSPFVGETDDMALNRIFSEAGLRVARILDVASDSGCLLLEDLGDRSLELAMREPGAARPLLEQAVGLAADVARRGSPVLERAGRAPALDPERFRFEMDFFLEHYARGMRRARRLPDRLTEELYALADLAADAPRRVLCHRDFHSRNLMVLGDGTMSMVDIQDARWGPDTYDLASLLRDAYLEIDEGWIDPLIDLHRSRVEDPSSAAQTRRRFDIVGAQRMIKALGTFGYQTSVLGRTRYRGAIPRTLERLRQWLPVRQETEPLFGLLRDSGLLGGPGQASDRT